MHQLPCCVCLQVHYILQEVVMGGMVLETNMNEIVAQVEVQNRMEKSEVSLLPTLKDPASATSVNILLVRSRHLHWLPVTLLLAS